MDQNNEILRQLEKKYFGMDTALNYKNSYQLLVAAMLSAQSTDERVNLITANLFIYYGNAENMSNLTQNSLEEKIKSIGLYHNKAKNILAMSKMLLKKYHGELPTTREQLMELPGVGRKTANIILANVYGIPAIAVDTHVFRVSNRLGLANASTPEKTELQLMKNIPQENWSDAHHWLIWHGRKICHARKPECKNCFLQTLCPYAHNLIFDI